MTMKHVIYGCTAVVWAALPAFAQTSTTKNPSTVATADRSFVTEAARGGLAEVELGKLAADKSSSADVKKFAQRMQDDHSKANDELKTLADSKNITVPTVVSAKDKALIDRLSKLSGAAFDEAYMRAMVNDHVTDVNLFKRETNTGKDADIKAFAVKTLPTLEDHLTMARSTDKEVVGTSGKK